MIVITTPTGQIGHHVVEDLLDKDVPLRLVARDPSKLPETIRQRAEIVEGSHGDPAVADRAFEGADAVFWLVPPNPKATLEQAYLDFTRPAAEAFRRHGVKRVVGVTALGRGTAWENQAGLVTAAIRMDDIVMASGVAFRGLAMPSFMDNLLRQVGSIKTEGMMFGSIDPDKTLPTTATRDMGAVAARLLTDDSWTGREELPVLGPEDLSFNDMAATISDVIGREIRYQQTPFDAFKEQLLDTGMGESFAQGYVDMMRAKNDGMDNVAERTAESRTPTTFRQWCEDVLKPAVLG